MPLYDYQCKDCSFIFEVRTTFQEKEQGLSLTCLRCGGHEARQLLTARLLLHGGGESPMPVYGCNRGGGCCG